MCDLFAVQQPVIKATVGQHDERLIIAFGVYDRPRWLRTLFPQDSQSLSGSEIRDLMQPSPPKVITVVRFTNHQNACCMLHKIGYKRL